MIDLHPETLSENETLRLKNRAGDFFCKTGNRVGIFTNDPSVYAGENRIYSYGACRGVSLSQSEDSRDAPIIEDQVVLEYVYGGRDNPLLPESLDLLTDLADLVQNGAESALGGDLVIRAKTLLSGKFEGVKRKL